MPTVTTLNSIESYNKYGVHRSVLQHIASYLKSVPPEFRDCFSTYYKLYWSRDYLIEQLRDSKYFITKDNKQYYVIWKTSRGTFLNSSEKSQYCLSFRDAQPEFDIPPYVLIWLEEKMVTFQRI